MIVSMQCRCMVRSVMMKPDCDLLYKWLGPALVMLANIPEPVTVFNRTSASVSLLSPIGMLSHRGRMQSHSDDSGDLGSFFKDIVACHNQRDVDAITNSNSCSEMTDRLDYEGDSDDGVNDNTESSLLPLKYKPCGNIYPERQPSSMNMRSHVFVEDCSEEDEDALRNMTVRNRVSHLERCKSEKLDTLKYFDQSDSSTINLSKRYRSSESKDKGDNLTVKELGIEGCICPSHEMCSCAFSLRPMIGENEVTTYRRLSVAQNIDGTRPPPNPIEHEVELEKEICTLIIERMIRYRSDVPEPLKMLFKSLRDVCASRDLTGIENKSTGCSTYYTACSTRSRSPSASQVEYSRSRLSE